MAAAPASQSIMLLAVTVAAFVVVLAGIAYFLCCLWRSNARGMRTAPFDSPSPLNGVQTFSFKELKTATHNFSASNSIGKGGSGAVYRGVLKDGKVVAVKVLHFQGEYEFQNEVKILGGLNKPCPLVVSLLGFCVEEGKRLLVYDYMPNRSLQESLFLESDDESSTLTWSRRFAIIHDVVKALVFLHLECHPPVIHGDVKPSNVLLDSEFRARISDFGLSRLKLVSEHGVDLFSQDLRNIQENVASQEEVIIRPNDEIDFAQALRISAPTTTNNCKIYHDTMKKHNLDPCDSKGKGGSAPASANAGVWNTSLPSDADLGSTDCSRDLKSMPFDADLSSTDHSRDLGPSSDKGESINVGGNQWGEDWWWKQDGSGELCSKEYVMEWIRSQIYPSDIPDWDVEKGMVILGKADLDDSVNDHEMAENPTQDQQCEAEKERTNGQVKKHRKMVEWWKEEQLSDTTSNKVTTSSRSKRIVVPHLGLGKCFTNSKTGRHENDDDNFEFSFRRGCGEERPSPSQSGDMFSRELSSTTSVRGTFCYAAPEHSEHNYSMEKADIYSLGVLILVTVSGRRPLHVLPSPMKFKKANLISWTKSLAHSGNILELVDSKLGDEYNKEEASLCINLALYCLQRTPDLRPGIGDVLRILNGETELLPRPCNFSPPTPLRFSQKPRRRQRA